MSYAWSWDDVVQEHKVCSRCGTDKPLTEFHKTRDDAGRPRAHPWCKACRSVARKIAG